MEIRFAYRHDLTRLVRIFENYRIFYGMESNPGRAEAFLLARIKGEESVIFVAEEANQELVGFTQLYPLFSSTRMQRLWLLNDLFVEENGRGKGIATKLIERAKQHAKETNACGLILETARANANANSLYQKHSFILDIHHNHYFWETGL